MFSKFKAVLRLWNGQTINQLHAQRPVGRLRLFTALAVSLTFFTLAPVAQAQVRLVSFLSDDQEVQDPPVNVGSFGFGEVTFDIVDGKVIASIEVKGLIRSGTDVTRLHIHDAPRGENGPIVVNFFDTVLTPDRDPDTLPVRRRGFVRLRFTEEIDPELALEILLFPEDFYINLHTVEFPGGEIRGQLAAPFFKF